MEADMRSMMDMDTVQIEITNHCLYSCANCSRFCPQVKKPFFMNTDTFKRAVDSMIGYPKMVGIQGGEPLLHPTFPEFCAYLREKIPYEQCGLWTTLPKGYEQYAEDICKTFKHIFINDHSRSDIFHHAPLVAIREVIKDEHEMWQRIDHCWAQESWSASINPQGAWFCEIAASFSMLLSDSENGLAWSVEPGWWWRIPKDFGDQMEAFCPTCGFPCKVLRRGSTEQIDDISPLNAELFAPFLRNPKRLCTHSLEESKMLQALAAYKDTAYRNRIADRYGMFVLVNDQNFWTPYLRTSKEPALESRTLVDVYQEWMRCGTW
jgi:organic radical activating enzyme